MGVVLRRHLDAEDVLHDAWLVLLRDSKQSAATGSADELSHRLVAIAELRLLDAARRRSRIEILREIELDAQESDADAAVARIEAEEDTNRLRRAMHRLSTSHRRVLELRYWDEFEFVDVAAALGLPTSNAARTLHKRALASLRRIMASTRRAVPRA